ncbi:hypothetical protein KIH39_18185 [Telmatocola sphagniphila]|uniref:Tetratricopeptide repeat protein n=1 Tax=Telmatocola sphagniphila TaxID=1123043 RepID=A0A8E6ESI0_9BACT|nr:hypothetical protein [Telmatocola sphagniphila]QVL30769.1 hypothetical protein KIH39_18185 [Telmatocola sphagniphila]
MKKLILLAALTALSLSASSAQAQRGGGGHAGGGFSGGGVRGGSFSSISRPAFSSYSNYGGAYHSSYASSFGTNRYYGSAYNPSYVGGFRADRPAFVNNVYARPGTRGWYDYNYHSYWSHGYWPWWNYGWGWGYYGYGFAPLLPWGGVASYYYSNPYYINPTTYNIQPAEPAYDYSRPILPPAEAPVANSVSGQSGIRIFQVARELFRAGEYKKALDINEAAIKEIPRDPILHEFRALSLFALKDYKQSAATVYTVLAAGPGWDWDTLRSLYADPETYTQQLRDLEKYRIDHPTEPAAAFLLAYHYLVLNYPEQASQMLEKVVKMQPNDLLAAQMLKTLKTKSDKPKPNLEPPQAQPAQPPAANEPEVLPLPKGK